MTTKFIKELANEFWCKKEEFKIDTKSTLVYFFLMKEFANNKYKPLSFPTSFIEENLGINTKEALQCANLLKNASLISYGYGFSFENLTITYKLKKK